MSDFEADLHRQLMKWAEDYGGEEFRRLRACSLDRVRGVADNDDDGGLPGVATEIQRHVARMQSLGRWKEAWVIRVEYMMPGLSDDERIARLNQMGLQISRATYYVYLRSAKTFLAGAVSAHATSDAETKRSA